MSVDLQQLRVDLAVALRWAARLDLHEGVDNHFSAAVPDDDGVVRGDRFLINPFGWHWSEITASSLVLCDVEGNVLEGDNTVEATAFYIHSRVHLMAPSAAVALHTHMPYATALTLLEGGRLEMCEQNALMFDDRIAYDDDYAGLALDADEGDRLAAKLGNRSVLMMASHGVMVVGPNIAEAFNDLYYLERAAKFQILARSTGLPLRTISDRVRDTVRQQMATERGKVADRHFAALRRILDRQEPAYRN
ncbi:MAG: aldolase [Alphaproteobacteria bacterium]|jgi:ribulose-5-phosphate 4-epimerase/fuculose-1-phosphate aldolase|nr:aldolase [Alphaproteobacteria bacterium]MDP6565585.1 aldolase [Alphaproteobacteria bacterium]MDP6814624.1 aldolase [Alphaproteobacteria bacterium]